MSARLMLGFATMVVLALIAYALVISIVMRAQIYHTADDEMGWRARSAQAILQNEQAFMEQEAINSANLPGLDAALQKPDSGDLERLLTPGLKAHNLNAILVTDAADHLRMRSGDVVMDETHLEGIPLVDRAMSQLADSTFFQSGQDLWLLSAAPHQSPDGKTTAVILIGKRLDKQFLQSLASTLGNAIVLTWGDVAAYSFETPPPELTVHHLHASLGEVAEYRVQQVAFHTMNIGSQPYRVAAFNISTNSDGDLAVLLFRPTYEMDLSVQQALLGVFAISGLILLVGAPLVYWYAHSVTRPLDRLTTVARRIAGGDMEHVIQVERKDEVGELAHAFEEMRVQVQAMLQAQQKWNAELDAQVKNKTSELEDLLEIRDQLLQETLTIQEGERRRVARELHDETCQSLTALLANIATVQLLSPEQMQARLPELKGTVVNILKEVNRIVFALRPALLDDYGLIPALSWYAEQRLPAPIHLDISTTGPDMRLPANLETILFRIGQEAITNIAKYAGATYVRVKLTHTDEGESERVSLEIEDNGCGFDLEHWKAYTPHGRGHLGLLGMQERIGQARGRLEIQSAPGAGTRVHATIPLDSVSEPTTGAGEANAPSEDKTL
ncbi:MAG: HAMP domain-containing protein [Anaerolineae bacterium]